MNILLIGSGGREHALAWTISGSPLCDRLIITPGNPGAAAFGKLADVAADNIDGLVTLAKTEAADIVVIGPEIPLVKGLSDRLEAEGIKAFGPSAAAAQLEGSKRFGREFCTRHNIPQPQWNYFTDANAAKAFAGTLTGGCVVKADGLAAGKGVTVCDTTEEAALSIDEMLGGRFGEASAQILVEERISGPEFSAFALLDGKQAIWLASAQDYKRAYDSDKGPNTGGMGAVSPSKFETDALRQQIMDEIIRPVATGMTDEGMPYRGILYAGLMLADKGPQVIEFNCRFGDPEAQVILPRLQSDLLSAIYTTTEGGLQNFAIRFAQESAVTVVMAAKGYPGSYEKGSVITGAETLEAASGCFVFHAGTAKDEEGQIIANGGRVLCVTALGTSIAQARAKAYQGVAEINWDEGFTRSDIAAD